MEKNLQKELVNLNAKCDLIIELCNKLSSDPDFIIERMRAIAFRQNLESGRGERNVCLKLLHDDSE